MKIPWDKHPWARYAATDRDGTIRAFRDKPLCAKSSGFWWNSIAYFDDTKCDLVIGDDKSCKDWEQSLKKKRNVKQKKSN